MGLLTRGRSSFTSLDGELGGGTDTSGASASSYTKSSNSRQHGDTAYLVIGAGGTASAARTISSVTVTLDGGSPITATELVASGSATYTQGLYIVDISSCDATYDITVNFSSTMLGYAMFFIEYGPFLGGGVASYTEAVTSGDPIASTSRTQSPDEVMVAICGNQTTAVTDVDWTYQAGTTEGNDLTYGSRMLSYFYFGPNAGELSASTVSADYNAAPINPRLCVAYIT